MWSPRIRIREDNQTCIHVCQSEKNPAMKELERAFGVFLAWIIGRLASRDYDITYCRAHDMTADIYTKGFNDIALLQRLGLLIDIYTLRS